MLQVGHMTLQIQNHFKFNAFCEVPENKKKLTSLFDKILPR